MQRLSVVTARERWAGATKGGLNRLDHSPHSADTFVSPRLLHQETANDRCNLRDRSR
jgi:hypothetical protein